MSDYTLYNADCLDVLPTLAPQSVDAVICDPPYGTTACKWDSVIPFAPMWAGIKRVLKPRGACVLFGSQPFTSALVMSNPQWFRHEWIWNKPKGTNFANCVREPMREHESILVFSRGKWTFNRQMEARKGSGLERIRYPRRDYGASENYGKMTPQVRTEIAEMRVPSSVQKFNNQTGLHPTQKPVALLEYLIRTYTNEGDCVLDFTMGSGTTGHACGNLGRRFVGIEQDAGYFAIAEERIATAYAPLRHMQAAVV
jgi:site-specific DNA-methyltransferase (adenine-specific)